MNFLSFSSPLKRFYKFLLKRILGSFLQYDLDLNQLDVQLGKGEVVLKDLELNVQMLNDLCVDLPITFIRARIRLVKATIPWRNLLTKNCILKLDGWELVVVPSEQVQHKCWLKSRAEIRASGTFSTLLAQSVMSDIDPRDLALQASLASLGQHFRPSSAASTSSGASSASDHRRKSNPQTPMSMSGSVSTPYGASPARTKVQRHAEEEEEEKRHEALTAAGVRARERRRKAHLERQRRREESLSEEDEDADQQDDEPSVHIDDATSAYSDIEDEDEAEEARSKRAHSARQAAAFDTANQGLQVVASFLEQVVSAIELEVTDVTLRVQHQPKVGQKQTTLLVKLPWVHFSDLNKEAKEAADAREAEEKKEIETRAIERAQKKEARRIAREHERIRRAAERQARGEEAKEDIDSDLDALAHEDDAEAEAEAEVEASIRRAFEARLARERDGSLASGPKYEYHKAIRFHGFRVELQEETAIDTSFAQFPAAAASVRPGASIDEVLDDSNASQHSTSEPQTIISGSMDQTCMITLKLKMQDTAHDQPKLESTCFIQSLRALLTPKQLALLTDLSAAIALSAKQVALNAQLSQSTTIPIVPQLPNAAGGFSPSIASATAATTSSSSRSAHSHSSSSAPPLHPNRAPNDVVLPAASLSTADSPVIHLWSMETHILNCSLTITESDEQTWSTDWWLAPTMPPVNASNPNSSSAATSPPSSSSSPNAIVQSVIPAIHSNHLYLSSHHTFINIHQTSIESTVKVTLGSVQLDEYLLQHRVGAPSRRSSITSVSESDFIGFKARPLISFLNPVAPPHPSDLRYPTPDSEQFFQSARTVAAPHLSFEYRMSVDSTSTLTFNEPPNLFFESHPNSTVNSRLTLSCQPANIDMDLGLGSRLKNLLDAVSAPTAYLNAGQLPSSTNSDAQSFTFDTNRPSSSHYNHHAEEMLHEIRRQSGATAPPRTEPSSYAQIVLIAPTINLNILFPAYTPSQQQPHAYSRIEQLAAGEYTDARGVLRPERISLECHEVSLANEVDITSIPPMTDPLINPSLLIDSEWMIRFHKAQVFMHYPNLGPDGLHAVDAIDMNTNTVRKRIVSTLYPTQHAVSASSAYFSHAAVASYISIFTRAPIVPGAPLRSVGDRDGDSMFGDTHSPSTESTSQQRQEEMFFDGLPHAKHWESETLNGERKRVFKPQRSTSDSSTNSQPDAAIFESLALQNSSLVVTIHLPVAALHLAKHDYDLLLFLYTIFNEIMEPPPPPQATLESMEEPSLDNNAQLSQSTLFTNEVAPQSMYESSLSALDEEHDQVDINGLSRSVHYRHPPGLTSLQPPNDDDDDQNDFDSNAPGSLSRSDSFSSDSSNEMFESVGGADSVILNKMQPHRSKHDFPNSSPNRLANSTLFGANSLILKSSSAASTLLLSPTGTDDSHLARQVKQYYLQRQPLTWLQLKRLILGVPHGMKGNTQQEQFIRGEHALSAWIRGKQITIPPRWQQYRQRMNDLFGQIQLMPLIGMQSIESEEDDDSGDAPLTQDSLFANRSTSDNLLESKSNHDGIGGDGDSPQFPPTYDSDASSRTPSPTRSPMLSPLVSQQQQHQAESTTVHETNLSDAESEGSFSGDEEVDDSQTTVDHDNDQRKKRITFGTESIVFGQSHTSNNALNGASGDLHSDGDDTASHADSTSDSTDINPTAIFARASRTSGESQLFQPAAMSLPNVLPPLNHDVVNSYLTPSLHQQQQQALQVQSQAQSRSSLANSSTYGMQSSMMDSQAPDMFHSFTQPPAGVFDPTASINPDLSIDYSHLPPQMAAARLVASQAHSLHELPPLHMISSISNAPVRSSHLAASRPPPVQVPHLSSSQLFPNRPQPPVATIAPARLPSPYKHFLSLRLNIQRASITIQDDPESNSRASANAPLAASPLPGSVPQTFHIDIGEVRLFQVAEFEGKPVTYISIRAGDLTVREYRSVITDEKQLFSTPSMPILFKTMSDDQHQSTPKMDAWGRPLEVEQKYGDDSDIMSMQQNSDSPLPSAYNTRHAHEATSVAWSNPVLLINIVMKVKPHLNLRDTQAVINLRALTLQFFPQSQWIQKLMLFFTPTVYVPPVVAPSFNLAIPAPPPPPTVMKDLAHIFLHGYDVSVDYNPSEIAPRAVLSIDHVHLQTTVYPDSTVNVLKLEVRDVAMFMIPKSMKAIYAPCMVLSELGYPFLHRVRGPTLFAHLETIGYARLATMDFLDAIITQNVPSATIPPPAVKQVHIPALSVEVTNGLLTLLTCWDSFQVFTEVCAHFVESIQEIQQVAEIDVRFANEPTSQSYTSASAPRPSSSYQITASAAVNSETSGGSHIKAFSTSHQHQRAAYLLDEDEEENDGDTDGDEAMIGTVSALRRPQPAATNPSATAASSSSAAPVERNILDQLDHNAFGADMGVAQVYSHESDFSTHQFNDNYHDERLRQTSLSLALQAAAEREIARARREELGTLNNDPSMSMYGLQRANSGSPTRINSASSVPSSEQAARWLSTRESDEMMEKDKHDAYIASLTDEESRAREEELAREKEDRRRRREEERASKEANIKKSLDPKDTRIPPKLIDDHVPLADEDTRTGRARLKPPADYPNAVTEMLLLNLSVCWRMFGGQDWDMTLAAPSPNADRKSHRRAGSEDLPEVNNSAMGSVSIMDFYRESEPFVKPSPNPFSSPYGARGGALPTSRSSQSGFNSSTPSLDRNRSNDAYGSVPPSELIPRGFRQTDRVMEIMVRGASVRFDQYPTGVQIASRVVIALDDIEVHDLIATSPFKNFLCYYSTGSRGRELGSSMIRLEMTSVRPDPSRPREEFRIKLSVLPLRLNVDQDAVDFFIQFFTPRPSLSGAVSANDDGVASTDLLAAANFNDSYRSDDTSIMPLTPARADFLSAVTHYLKTGGVLSSPVPSTAQARVTMERLLKSNAINQHGLALAIGYSDAHITRWLRGEYEDTVGSAALVLLNQLLPSAISSAAHNQTNEEDDEDNESDASDDGMSAGIGGLVIGAGGGRSPLRRMSHDPLESFQPFHIPPMPVEWIPFEISKHQSHLVPVLVEAYHKYYDVCHASMTQSDVNSIEPWRPTPELLSLLPHESVSDYRTRLLTAARAAARTKLKMMNSGSGVREVENQVYIQSFQVMHKITLCIDWKPNTFDLEGLRGGDYAQLANLLPLENMELDLKAIRMTGITGFGRVGIEVAKLWAYDISRHQAHRYLAGVQPIRSMVNVGAGVADLVLLPVSHYHHHGNLKRGVQRGLSSFLKNVSLESMSAAARLAQGAQTVLETVDDVVTFAPTPLPKHAQAQYANQRARHANSRRGRNSADAAAASSSSSSSSSRRAPHISKQANPPASAHEGFRQAYESLARGFQSAAQQMIVVPRDEYMRYGSKGAIKSAFQSMPSSVVKPLIGGMEAIAKVLNGVTNSIDPKRKKEKEDKFKSGN